MAYPRDRRQARALVLAFREYERTGRSLRAIEACTEVHPEAGTRCVLAKHRRAMSQHLDGPINGVRTRRW